MTAHRIAFALSLWFAGGIPVHADLVNNLSSRTIVAQVPDGTWPGTDLLATPTGMSPIVDDCDKIRAFKRPVSSPNTPPGGVEIAFSRGPASSGWWKELQVWVSGRMVARTVLPSTGPSTTMHGGLVAILLPEELLTTVLVFIKPKTLGVPTPVYQMVDLTDYEGQVLWFTWDSDHC